MSRGDFCLFYTIPEDFVQGGLYILGKSVCKFFCNPANKPFLSYLTVIKNIRKINPCEMAFDL